MRPGCAAYCHVIQEKLSGRVVVLSIKHALKPCSAIGMSLLDLVNNAKRKEAEVRQEHLSSIDVSCE